MAALLNPPAGRKTLRLSHPVARTGPGAGGQGMGRGTPRRAGTEPSPADAEPAAEVAAAAFKAVEQAGSHLGAATLDNGLTAEEVLSNPANRAVAARWRSGSMPRRITAALARAMQSLQEWSPSGALPAGRPAAAEPLPVRGSRGTPAAPSSTVQLWPLPWWVPRVTFRTGVLLLVLLLFPRVVALVFALVFRLLSRAAVSFLANVFLEIYQQAMFSAADVEEFLVQWLHQQLGWQTTTPSPEPVFLAASAQPLPAAPPAAQGQVSLPTRPIDILIVILLGLNLRQQPLLGGGGNQVAG